MGLVSFYIQLYQVVRCCTHIVESWLNSESFHEIFVMKQSGKVMRF
jgi:hypothetical protein